MRFETMKEARQYAKIESVILNRKIKAIKTKFFDMNKYDFVDAYTVYMVTN